MKVNVSGLESFFRIFAGVTLLYFTLHGDIGSWGFLGGVLIATGLSGMCPLKAIFGIGGGAAAGSKESH